MRTGSSVRIAWIHGDHLGSASLTTNISGQVVSEMRYYPFGEVRWQNGSTPTDRTFTGQLAEPSGLGSLMNYNAREYSPVLGRFLSADSVVPRPGDPQSLNRFSYARNSPISRLDPSGHGDCNVHTTAGCLPWTIADLVFQGPDYLYQVTVKPDNSFNPYDLSGVTTAHVQQAAQLFNVPAPYVAAALNFENQPSQLPWGAFRRYGKQLAAPILQRINPGYGSLGLGYSLGPANIKPGQAAVLVKYYLTSYDPQSPEYQWALSQSQLPKEGGFQEALPENAASYVAAGIRWGIDNYYSRGYSGPISKEGAAVVIGSYGQPYWYKLNKEPAPGGSYGVALIVNYADTKQGLPFLGQ